MLALCRTWNAVRFFHPALTNEGDARWDDALLPAIASVEYDPATLRTAVSAMLATLHDPITTIEVNAVAGPAVSPSAETHDGIRIVHLGGYPDAANVAAYVKALNAASTPAMADRAIILDLRMSANATLDQLDSLRAVWTESDLATRVIAKPFPMPAAAQRYYLGFKPEFGSTSGDYHEGRETQGAERIRTPAAAARMIPTAFVIDATAFVPNEALAVERNGTGAIFSTDGTYGIPGGNVETLDEGDGLVVTMRLGLPLGPILVRPGGLDAARAWINAPAPAAPEPAVAGGGFDRYASTALPDDAHRVLATFRMWGTIAYAFPYRALMHDDWDAALVNGIAGVRAADSSLAYELALMKMYAHIHDSHGLILGPAKSSALGAEPAFLARYIEGQPTIVRVKPEAASRDGFAVGDVVEAIDGEAVAVRAARLRPYIAASTEQSAREILATNTRGPTLFSGAPGSTMTLRLRGLDGRVRTVRTQREPGLAEGLGHRSRPAIDVLPGNVGYIDLQRLTVGDIDTAIARVVHTRAIVFDLRGYPRGTVFILAPHFATRITRVALFHTPVRRLPLTASGTIDGVEFPEETRDLYQLVAPAAPHLTQPVVVLIDSRAISQSEHSALFLKAAANARIVGEPSMGANGDISGMSLPGGINAYFTGQAVLHPDGSQLQRVGIIPDIRVAPALRGVRAGDDEILSAGLREALRLGHATAAERDRALAAERRAERAVAHADQTIVPPAPVHLSSDAKPLPDAFAATTPGYETSHDPTIRHGWQPSVALHAAAPAPGTPFGSNVLTIAVEPYRGKRIRVSGYLRSDGVTSASFWLRVDGQQKAIDAFDNMQNRPFIGTRDWSPFSIVLDVPDDAVRIVGGLLLQGTTGTIWADDLTIDVVDSSVPATAM